MKESFIKAQDFLNAVFERAGFDLRATSTNGEHGVYLDIDGDDAALLRAEGGELLDALEHLINQIYSRDLSGEHLACDVHGFRAMREAELQAMARHAAVRVRTTGVPFTFGAMSSSERRVIHLSLSGDADLHTESIGEGQARRLKVSLKSTNA